MECAASGAPIETLAVDGIIVGAYKDLKDSPTGAFSRLRSALAPSLSRIFHFFIFI
jgi:hypothetical protein